MDPLTEAIGEKLEVLHERGWEFPIYAVTVSTNGCINAVEFTENEGRIVMTYNPNNEGLRVPIHMMFVDSSGRFGPEVFSVKVSPFKDGPIQ